MCQQRGLARAVATIIYGLLPGHGAAVKTRLLGKHQVKLGWKCRHNPEAPEASLRHRLYSGSFLALLLFFPEIAC